MRQFLETAATLGPKLGALLFQLPPNFKKDLPLFDAFLDTFPPRVCAAFEFRHTSWLDDEVYARLRARNLALCVADSEKLSTPVEITADYAYFRLRDEGYRRPTSRAGPTSFARRRQAVRRSSCTSSTKRAGKARSSRKASDGQSRIWRRGGSVDPPLRAETFRGDDQKSTCTLNRMNRGNSTAVGCIHRAPFVAGS